MGWTFAYSTSYDKKALIADLRRADRWAPGTELLKACTVGNRHWYLARTAGVTWIGLDLLAGGGRESGWGSKAMDETVGPNYYDCPISYLDLASAPTGYAVAWREAVRKQHAAKRATHKPAAGLVVKYAGVSYTLVRPNAPRMGWTVRLTDGLAEYRMKSKQLSAALRTE
jgi:hypothetical protein